MCHTFGLPGYTNNYIKKSAYAKDLLYKQGISNKRGLYRFIYYYAKKQK